MPQKLALYGATGTIGDNALALVDAQREQFDIKLLSANTNMEKLAKLAKKYNPSCVVVGAGQNKIFTELAPDFNGEIYEGESGLLASVSTSGEFDLALMAIVGFAALAPTFALVQGGTAVALANKESLVVAGELLMQAATAPILPVDSEHNAIFQLLHDKPASARARIDKIIITASGGPFRTHTREQMRDATPAQAVAHPNWQMGAKISVDSATLMNKGLELIEARNLFGIAPTQLDVLIHPQSIVHGLVYFNDGSVLAQKSLPDMKIPLASVLAYPDRMPSGVAALDLAAVGSLEFAPACREQFPCLALAEQAMREGGAAPTILNAANEIAVAAFLNGSIGFLDIEEEVARALQNCPNSGANTSLEELVDCDKSTRKFCINQIENRL